MLLKMPRWPLKLISSPSGPCTILTPGVSVSRSSNLRPRTGVWLTVSWFSVELDSVFVISTVGVAVTTIRSATAEIFMLTGREMAWPTVRFTFSCTIVAKPCFEIVTVYRPGGRSRNWKRPSEPVVSVLVKLVSRFLMTTVASGTERPFSSTTSPCTVPVVICDCARAELAATRHNANRNTTPTSFFMEILRKKDPAIQSGRDKQPNEHPQSTRLQGRQLTAAARRFATAAFVENRQAGASPFGVGG